MPICIWKKEGETPLECLHRLRVAQPFYRTAKLSYAGRLDPMASGELLVLIGDECKEKDTYLSADKDYTGIFLCGISTDTYDALGIVMCHDVFVPNISLSNFDAQYKKYIGTHDHVYPPYSSKPINGVPLFMHARRGDVSHPLPHRRITIYTFTGHSLYTIVGEELLNEHEKRVRKMTGDFRQDTIIASWKKHIEKDKTYLCTDFSISCSSGTYIRRLADMIGCALQTPMLLWHLVRTRVHAEAERIEI